jgi:outer membrane protein assembly factor BamB
MQASRFSLGLAILLGASVLALPVKSADPATGWRGNGTGLWPDATPPLEWGRIPRGALDGLRSQATLPQGAEAEQATLVEKGLLRDWLVLGPFAVEDSLKDFDKDIVNGEAGVEPVSGDKSGEREWKPATVPPDDIWVFGTAQMPWLDLAKVIGFQRNQLAYAHTYLFSPRGGPARIVVDHCFGLKAWVNGKEVYRQPQRGVALEYYTHLSQHEFRHLDQPSPQFDVTLKKGWNRLLLKMNTPNRDGFTNMRCSLRIIDAPDVKYEEKNILWMTPLPGRSTSTPILVGDRLFVMAEPDELLCLDKNSGRILWSAAINFYETLTAEERRAQPDFERVVEPMVTKLRAETDRIKRTRLRAEIQKALVAIDPTRFKLAADGHFEAHFGIVGFTMPTPVSDAKHVFVWSGMGVAACFDLDGKRQWITRVQTDELTYGSSPALADGVLVVFLNGLFGLDAKTGKQLWKQPKIRNNIGAVQGATLAGQPVIVTQRGDIIRPSDGSILFRPRDSTATGDIGWAPPVILGNSVFSPMYGVSSLRLWDYSAVTPPQWEPKLLTTIRLADGMGRGPKGQRVDVWTAGSPLIWDGLTYQVDIYQRLYVGDVKTGKTLYTHDLPLQGFMHYNSVPVAASPTLIGKHVVVQDNQGTAVVLATGSEYKVIARNHLGTQIARRWPIPSQETIGYAPPLASGERLYIRGEGFLYCIGKR